MSKRTLKTTNYQVPNLERGMIILETLSKYKEGKTQTELVELLGYPTNSIYRITMSLERQGYLSRHPKTKVFSLTDKLLSIGAVSISQQSVVELALPEMRKLRDLTKETVLIGTLIPSEGRGVALEQVAGLHPFKFSFDVGSNLILHVGAPGKALLAYLPKKEQNKVLKKLCYTKFTETTLTNEESLMENIGEGLKNGYFLDNGEWMEEMHCVGAAVRNSKGYPVAAIWVTGPSTRLPMESIAEVGELVKEACKKVSVGLGWHK